VKLALFLIGLTVVSAAVYAMDLPALARRERARRNAVSAKPGRAFGDDDLERYERRRDPDARPAVPAVPRAPAPPRDLTRERVYWRKEVEQHQREVAKINANLRRLEWRLNEKRSRRRNREWLAEDPAIGLLEDSIRALREERQRLEERFRERARKEGAFPGWLR